MSVPLKATNFHTTERLLELALTMLENARREQNNEQLPANNWLTNNFTLEIIRAKVAANKANATFKVQVSGLQRFFDFPNLGQWLLKQVTRIR